MVSIRSLLVDRDDLVQKIALLHVVAAIAGLIYLWYYILSKKSSAPFVDPIATAAKPNDAVARTAKQLQDALPHSIFSRQEPEFRASIRSLFDSDAQVPIPAFVIKPKNTAEVSTAVRILSKAVQRSKSDEPVQFAIRSGGHSVNRHFNSVDGGFTIDLSGFKCVHVAEDKSTATVEPGAKWGDVFHALEEHDLAVAGGRNSSVGVGGFTLGGGLSFHSSQIGLACDTVVSFEIVLADGSVITVTDKSHPDLTLALRGGGNNFGIVTKFTFRTFPQKKMWLGYYFFWPGQTQRMYEEYVKFCQPESFDKKATVIVTSNYAPGVPWMLPIMSVHYTDPVADPPALKPFSKIRRFWRTTKFRTLQDSSECIGQFSPPNKFNSYHTTSFYADTELLAFIAKAFKASRRPIKNVKGLVWTLVYQPIAPSATLYHKYNATGLELSKTLTSIEVLGVHDDAKAVELVTRTARRLLDLIEAETKRRELYHPYKYLNYVHATQWPFTGYAPGRLESLRETSKKYDPHGIFQKAVGGHKLWEEDETKKQR